MESLDPHLEILLQDFVRLCSEDTVPGEDCGAALHEIALFVHDERLHCSGSDIRDYLLEQGYPVSRSTFFGEQYDRLLQGLQRDTRRSQRPARPLDETGDPQKGIMR
jgi:hypothetical protein